MAKYTVYTYDEKNDADITASVNVRRGAKMKTVFFRCAEAMAKELHLFDKCQRVTWSADLPNIWTNGFCGFCCVSGDNNNYHLIIEEENGAILSN